MEPEQKLFVVADGMGGHAGGETASKITVDTIVESVIADRAANLQSMTPADLIIGSVHRANLAVHSAAQKDPNLAGMGTTVIVLLFENGQLTIGSVGDSRVYMARKGQIWQLTKDHSLVNEKLKAGLITREQLKHDKSRNVITRSVGFESSVLVDTYQKEVQKGDVYFACSDGLSGLASDEEMRSILDEEAFSAATLDNTVQKLIQRANDNGGDDNITVVAVRIED